MKETIDNTITALKNGNVVLYPTDTIVGLGCDATNIDAFNKVFEIKQRPKDKSLIVLVSSDAMLNKYVSEVPELAWDLMDCSDKPVTIIYSNPKNLPQEILAKDGSIAIRVVREGFCNRLIHKYNKPIISTSANISNTKAPSTVSEVSKSILEQVDYVVALSEATSKGKSSSIIKLGLNGEIEIIRT